MERQSRNHRASGLPDMMLIRVLGAAANTNTNTEGCIHFIESNLSQLNDVLDKMHEFNPNLSGLTTGDFMGKLSKSQDCKKVFVFIVFMYFFMAVFSPICRYSRI